MNDIQPRSVLSAGVLNVLSRTKRHCLVQRLRIDAVDVGFRRRAVWVTG